MPLLTPTTAQHDVAIVVCSSTRHNTRQTASLTCNLNQCELHALAKSAAGTHIHVHAAFCAPHRPASASKHMSDGTSHSCRDINAAINLTAFLRQPEFKHLGLLTHPLLMREEREVGSMYRRHASVRSALRDPTFNRVGFWTSARPARRPPLPLPRPAAAVHLRLPPAARPTLQRSPALAADERAVPLDAAAAAMLELNHQLGCQRLANSHGNCHRCNPPPRLSPLPHQRRRPPGLHRIPMRCAASNRSRRRRRRSPIQRVPWRRAPLQVRGLGPLRRRRALRGARCRRSP